VIDIVKKRGSTVMDNGHRGRFAQS